MSAPRIRSSPPEMFEDLLVADGSVCFPNDPRHYWSHDRRMKGRESNVCREYSGCTYVPPRLPLVLNPRSTKSISEHTSERSNYERAPTIPSRAYLYAFSLTIAKCAARESGTIVCAELRYNWDATRGIIATACAPLSILIINRAWTCVVRALNDHLFVV